MARLFIHGATPVWRLQTQYETDQVIYLNSIEQCRLGTGKASVTRPVWRTRRTGICCWCVPSIGGTQFPSNIILSFQKMAPSIQRVSHALCAIIEHKLDLVGCVKPFVFCCTTTLGQANTLHKCPKNVHITSCKWSKLEICISKCPLWHRSCSSPHSCRKIWRLTERQQLWSCCCWCYKINNFHTWDKKQQRRVHISIQNIWKWNSSWLTGDLSKLETER